MNWVVKVYFTHHIVTTFLILTFSVFLLVLCGYDLVLQHLGKYVAYICIKSMAPDLFYIKLILHGYVFWNTFCCHS